MYNNPSTALLVPGKLLTAFAWICFPGGSAKM